MGRASLAVVATAVLLIVGGTARATPGQTVGTPAASAHALLRQWTAYVEKGARLNPKPRFAKARRATVARIAQRNAGQFRYVVKRIRVLRGRDGAPMVVVGVLGRPLRFSRAFPALWRRLDPLTREPGPDWHAYKYEAFFFEALDSRGVPFLVVWNAWRQPPRGGGQWARTEALLPFQHG